MQPDSSAGTTLAATWFIGQFHGVIRAQTPTGSRTTLPRLPLLASQSNSRAAFSVSLMWPLPHSAWELNEKSLGAPISVVIASAITP